MRRHAKAIVAISALLLLTCALGAMSATAAAPTVSIDAPSAVSYTSAHVSGTVNPEDQETSYHFEYQVAAEWWMGWTSGPSQGPLAGGSGEAAVQDDLTGLKPNTEYAARLVAENADGQTASSEPTFTTLAVDPPTVSIDAPSSATASSAHLSGTINPNAPGGNPPEFDVDWSFECTPECPGLAGGTILADSSSHTVEADATGLAPGQAYKVTLVASNAAGSFSSDFETFKTSIVAPTVSNPVANPFANEANLSAILDPGGAKTTYYFEYGRTAAYGQQSSVRTATGAVPARVSTAVSGLSPQSTYHFRLVASNVAGRAEGSDQTFTTPAQGPDGCPNAAIRAEQGISNLASCRAFEMVSPVDKDGNSVDSRATVQSAPDGNSVAFSSNGAFPGAESSVKNGYYIARRGLDNWTTEALDAPQINATSGFANPSVYLSTDLSKTVQFSSAALVPGAIQYGTNLYLRDNITGARSLMAASPGRFWMNTTAGLGNRAVLLSASDDLSRFVFPSPEKLLADAPAFGSGLYEVADGQLNLVSQVGEPEEPAQGWLGNVAGTPAGGNQVSADGSRVFFQSPGNNLGGPLYMREGGKAEALSVSQRPGEEGSVADAEFVSATADGSVVYFISSSALTEEEVSGPALYRLDIDTRELKQVTPFDANSYSFLWKVLGISSDGSTAYFMSWNVYDEGATPFESNLYMAKGGVVRHIATLGSRETGGGASYALSPDGKTLAFSSVASPTGYDNRSPACSADPSLFALDGECSEVYVYDAATDQLTCPTCLEGVRKAHSSLAPQNATISEYLPRRVYNDGRVFFTSGEALVAEDVNGVSDVYEWRDGANHLVSSGKGGKPAFFASTSDDARDVYFVTSERLVPADVDNDADLYSSRRGGGMAAQNAPPPSPSGCSGEACQGLPPASSQTFGAGSSEVVGPGNVNYGRKHKMTNGIKHRKKHTKIKKKRCQKARGKSTAKKCSKGGKRSNRAAVRNGGTK